MSDQLSTDLASLRINRDAPTTSNATPSPLRRLVVPFVVVVAIGAAGWIGWRKLEGQLLKQEVETTEIALISPSQAEVQVTATGYVIPQRTSKVGSKLGGRLAKVFVKEGDTVKEGDILAQLEDNDQRSLIIAASSRVGVASSRIATARASLAEISQQVERERNLVASGTVGKANLDNLAARESALKASVKGAIAEANAAQAEAGTFGVGLKDRTIVAPISGRIVSKPATVGEFVGGFAVGLVAEIADFDSLMVETDVPEARLHVIKLGAPCEIVLDAYPQKRFRCTAHELGQRVNRAKATVMVKVKFEDSPENVLPEMSARVSFLSKAITDDALKETPKRVVSSGAIVERSGQKVVFVVEAGKLQAVPVKVGGPAGASAVELLEGPSPGAKVVAKPTAENVDGQRVKESEKK